MECGRPETDAAEIDFSAALISAHGVLCGGSPAVSVRGSLVWGFQCSETCNRRIRTSPGRNLSLDGVCHFPENGLAPFPSSCYGLGLVWRMFLFLFEGAEGEVLCGPDPVRIGPCVGCVEVSSLTVSICSEIKPHWRPDLGVSSPNRF